MGGITFANTGFIAFPSLSKLMGRESDSSSARRKDTDFPPLTFEAHLKLRYIFFYRYFFVSESEV